MSRAQTRSVWSGLVGGSATPAPADLFSGGRLSELLEPGLLFDCRRHRGCTQTVARIPLGAGQQPRVLYQAHGNFQRFFSSDPSGRYLILDASAETAHVNGWIDHGRLIPLAPANGNAVIYESW